jgi:leader peptidase (prepilin peptidase)/N-methyltransferase
MNFPPFPHPYLSLIALAGGLVIGSFINVVIHRGPSLWGLVDGEARGNLARPSSYCPACKAPIPASGLIPILSFLLQRGRCRNCAAPISPRYPIVEAMGGFVALAAVAAFGWTFAALAIAVLGFALLALAVIDLETGYLPDAITLPLIAAGLGANAFALLVPFTDALFGAVAGYAALQGVALAYKRLRGREGLGEGDAKLLAAIGAFGGWAILPFVVFVAALATLTVAVLGRKTALDQPVPFGPGLCAAGFAFAVAASAITNAP